MLVTVTDEKREEAASGIAMLAADRLTEENELNDLWKTSDEWEQLKLTQQVAYIGFSAILTSQRLC